MKLSEPTTLQSIADLLNAHFKGDPSQSIQGINEIHKVEQGDLTFVDHPKYYDQVLNSAATTILIDKEVEPPEGKGVIIVYDPFAAYNQLTNYYDPYYNPSLDDSGSNPFYQGENVSFGNGTSIFPGVYLGSDVKIGRHCTIYPNTVIYSGTEIGDNVVIQGNCVIGGDAFYFKDRDTYHDKLESVGKVVIDNDVEIGAGCTVDRGVSGITRIGEGTKLDGQVHIGHGVEIGKHCILAAQTGVGGKTVLEDKVKLWGQVGINKSIRIGEEAIVYACSCVSKSIPGGEIYFGSPAVPKGQAYKEAAAIRKLPTWMKSIDQKIKSLLNN